MEKLTKTIYIPGDSDITSYMDGSIEELIEVLIDRKKDAEEAGLKNISVELSIDYDYEDTEASVYLKGERLETDKEHESRIKFKEKCKRVAEEKERKEYERLKGKFEGI